MRKEQNELINSIPSKRIIRFPSDEELDELLPFLLCSFFIFFAGFFISFSCFFISFISFFIFFDNSFSFFLMLFHLCLSLPLFYLFYSLMYLLTYLFFLYMYYLNRHISPKIVGISLFYSLLILFF